MGWLVGGLGGGVDCALLRLHHQLRTGVRPAGELGGGHGDLALREVADLDLRTGHVNVRTGRQVESQSVCAIGVPGSQLAS